MSSHITRRDFGHRVATGAGAIFLGAGGSWALAGSPNQEWAFPLLGDLHIDHPDHHDMAWLRKEHPNDVSQMQNYSRISREFTPRLLAVAGQQARESRLHVPFVLQLGDLIEGLCGSERLATRQASDA